MSNLLLNVIANAAPIMPKMLAYGGLASLAVDIVSTTSRELDSRNAVCQ